MRICSKLHASHSAGKYSPRTRQTSSETCKLCSPGKYSAAAGLGAEDLCTPCAPGKVQLLNISGANSVTACVSVPPKFQDEPGQIRCKDPQDTSFYADATGTTQIRIPEGAVLNCTQAATGRGVACNPETCPAGTAATSNTSSCAVCPAGWSSPRGSTACQPCEVGKLRPQPARPHAQRAAKTGEYTALTAEYGCSCATGPASTGTECVARAADDSLAVPAKVASHLQTLWPSKRRRGVGGRRYRA